MLGKSASGKDTIYHKLKEDERISFSYIVGYTTRPMREGECEGREYHFVTKETMDALEEAGKVIECRCYDTVYGKWYYATVDDGSVDLEHEDYLLIGTLESYKSIRQYYGPNAVYPIYIHVEDGLRLSRALSRERTQEEPKYAELCRRFLADCADFSKENILDAGIDKFYENIDLNECYEEIVKDICSQKKN